MAVIRESKKEQGSAMVEYMLCMAIVVLPTVLFFAPWTHDMAAAQGGGAFSFYFLLRSFYAKLIMFVGLPLL